jgi:predicted ATP-binding protein involved in virulence
MSSPDLRIDSLRLTNFRSFSTCEIDFHPSLTVLVAENGQGKSAILDAVSISLGPVLDVLTGTRRNRDLRISDAHLAKGYDDAMKCASHTSFEAKGLVAGRPTTWSRSLSTLSDHSRSSTKGLKDLSLGAASLHARLESLDESSVLPLIAVYGTGRLWNEQETASARKRARIDERSRLIGYIECFSPKSSFGLLSEWFENAFRDLGNAAYTREVFGQIGLVDVIKHAVREVLRPTGWQELNWDNKERILIVEHPEFGCLPLSLLSDGVRNMVSLVADIAHRCVRLNPQLDREAATRTPGILLIDEVDMHLHPRWQQIILELLQRSFPCLQMIVSTHSPHVLSAVSSDSIRIIEVQHGHGIVEQPELETKGVESSAVLAEVMDVKPAPPVDEARWLSEYRALVQTSNQDSDEAKELWQRLLEHYGRGHPVMEEVEVLRRLQEFRRNNNVPPQRGV